MEEEDPKRFQNMFEVVLGVGLGVNERGKTGSQSFGPEPFENFRT